MVISSPEERERERERGGGVGRYKTDRQTERSRECMYVRTKLSKINSDVYL